MKTNILTPLSSKKLKKYEFIGFDVETYGQKNKFYCGSLFYIENNKEVSKTFFKRDEMINFLISRKFKNKYIVATNLGFDLTALFFDTKFWNNLKIIERNGSIVYAEYIYYHNKKSGKKEKIKFIDTTNYIFWSVEKLGIILNIQKLNKPKCIGKIPNNEKEKKELVTYNIRDAEISAKFLYFLQDGINKAGGNLKITIASTSFDVWRRNFLKNKLVKESYILKDEKIRELIFKGYYGGRTEIYKKGKFKNVFYYDINSLYPSVMRKSYPLPNSVKKVIRGNKQNIINYMGVSEVLIKTPKYMDKPFLPFRDKKRNKLIFPLGTFKGVYNHNELQKALSLNYEIIKVYNQIIYTSSFYPFKDFVNYFYKKRLEYKENKSPMELVIKLILNSLYGKFGQKIINDYLIIDTKFWDNGYKELVKLIDGKEYILNDTKIIISNKKEYNGKNSYPILSSYVTSYARILMYDYINNDDVLYTDTDSIITQNNLNINFKELGFMKLEGNFKECYLLKPKMYYIIDENNKIDVKIKGINKPNIENFNDILKGKSIKKEKFSKMRESMRRNLQINEKIIIEKILNLDDNKRQWFKKGNIKISKPLII